MKILCSNSKGSLKSYICIDVLEVQQRVSVGLETNGFPYKYVSFNETLRWIWDPHSHSYSYIGLLWYRREASIFSFSIVQTISFVFKSNEITIF